MPTRPIACCSLCVVLALAALAMLYEGVAPSAEAWQGTPPPASETKPTLHHLSWMTGSWSGKAFGGRVEEHWSAEDGGSMIGMFRHVSDDEKSRFYEFMTIDVEGEKTVYRFCHIGPGYKLWEDPAKPLTFDLVRAGENEAVFESTVQERPKRLIYHRDGETLAVKVESEKDGRVDSTFEVVMQATVLGRR